MKAREKGRGGGSEYKEDLGVRERGRVGKGERKKRGKRRQEVSGG